MPACAQREKEREQERKDEQDLDDPTLGTPGGDDEHEATTPFLSKAIPPAAKVCYTTS